MNDDLTVRLFILIGGKIKKYRREMHPKELGNKVNLSRTSIANIEKGRQHVTIDALWRIAAVLNVDPHLLLPTADEVEVTFDDIYLKQLALSEAKKRWVKGVIKSGKANKQTN
jgi:transcriptional regulator with XRE-family HTH domain